MFGSKESSESKLLQEQTSLARAQIKELKRARRDEQARSTGKRLGWVFKNTIPRGIKHPDSLVTNTHLYVPGRRGKTRLK